MQSYFAILPTKNIKIGSFFTELLAKSNGAITFLKHGV